MSELENVDAAELREWLENVERPESAEMLTLAIAHERGVAIDDLAEWYDRSPEAIREWFQELESGATVAAIAETEGVGVEELADRYGVAPGTVRDWFADLENEPVETAMSYIARYAQRGSAPVFRQTRARVEYLDHEAIEDRGWSVDDEDLFEAASAADLGPEEYGRIVVEPGETILEAAESRGFSWPFACRAGACANCATLVVDGDIAMPGNNVLTDEQVSAMNARLTCVGVPVTESVKLIKNVQHLDQFDDLRLPSPFGGGGP